MKRIHKIKTDKVIKDTYSDETLELLRDNCNCLRDLAIIDILASTGMRVGELVKLNINDIDLKIGNVSYLVKEIKKDQFILMQEPKIHLKELLEF